MRFLEQTSYGFQEEMCQWIDFMKRLHGMAHKIGIETWPITHEGSPCFMYWGLGRMKTGTRFMYA